MFENIHMLLMVVLSTIVSIVPHLFPVNLRRYQISWVTVRLQLSQGWLVEAPNPHGMAPKSKMYIYKVFNTIRMLWMGRWIPHHATSSILVGEDFWELEDFLDHSKAANDIKAGWFRPQTHMEWFPHLPCTPTRCLRPFICCGWADGSTIMPF